MVRLMTARHLRAALAVLLLFGCDSGDRPWAMSDKTDKISGKSFYEVDATAVADDGSLFFLSASCAPGFATITITAKEEKKIAAAGTLRLRFDEGSEKQSPASIGTGGGTAILFHDRDFAADFIARGIGAPEPLAKMISEAGANGIVAAGAGRMISASSTGTTQQLYSSDLMKIEVPLENGKKPVVSVSLKAGDFARFAARCDADQQKIMTDAEKERYERLKNSLTVSAYMKKLRAALSQQSMDTASYEEDLKKLTAFMEPCAMQAQTVNDQHMTQGQAGALAQGRNCHVMPPAMITGPGVKRPVFLYAGVAWDDKRSSAHFKATVFTSDPDEPEPDKYPSVPLTKKAVPLVDADVLPD